MSPEGTSDHDHPDRPGTGDVATSLLLKGSTTSFADCAGFTEMKYPISTMRQLMRTFGLLVAISPAAAPQTSDVAQIERRGDSAVVSVNTFRPLDAIASQLESMEPTTSG